VLSGGTSPTLSPLGVEGPGICAGNDDSERLMSVVWSKKVPETVEIYLPEKRIPWPDRLQAEQSLDCGPFSSPKSACPGRYAGAS